MKMKIYSRLLNEQDYDVLVEYWKWNRFPPPPKEALPDMGLGGKMIVDEAGNNICAGFLYHTNSALAWIEFCVASPYIKDREIRKKALVMLITELTNDARNDGYLAVFASIKNQHLIERYIEAGFSKSDSTTTELIIRL